LLQDYFFRIRFGTIRAVKQADPVESWRSLSATHALVRAALDNELRREHAISSVEFEVLESIAAGSAGRARMQEVSSSAHLTQSTASRVVARLENEGLAVRSICPEDRRGIFAAATPAGRERVAAAARTYRRVIMENMNGA
jgi:DNA-binding MarR family transcriptional regulator